MGKSSAMLRSDDLGSATHEAADLIYATLPSDDLGHVTLQAARETDTPSHTSSSQLLESHPSLDKQILRVLLFRPWLLLSFLQDQSTVHYLIERLLPSALRKALVGTVHDHLEEVLRNCLLHCALRNALLGNVHDHLTDLTARSETRSWESMVTSRISFTPVGSPVCSETRCWEVSVITLRSSARSEARCL